MAPLIAHIVYALDTGGLENGLVNIINRMPADQYRHAIICLTKSGAFASRITLPGVDIYELQKEPGNDFSVHRKLRRIIKLIQPAIVHTRNLTTLEMQLVTLLLPGIKRVHGEHGRDIHDLEGRNWKYNMLRRFVSLFVARYIAVSKDLEQWLLQVVGIPSRKIRQIYNGVDNSRFSVSSRLAVADIPKTFLETDLTVVGTVGRLAEVKNQKLLIEAFASLLSYHPEFKDRVRLLLVGDGPLQEELTQLVIDFDLQDAVWMPGDRQDIPQLMGLMDIFVLPSLAEGISNTVLEAMSSGLPVVATDVGGNPELIEDGIHGLLVPSKDPAKLVDALKTLVDRPELRKAMGQAGREKVERLFSWDLTVSRYVAVYNEVMSS